MFNSVMFESVKEFSKHSSASFCIETQREGPAKRHQPLVAYQVENDVLKSASFPDLTGTGAIPVNLYRHIILC